MDQDHQSKRAGELLAQAAAIAAAIFAVVYSFIKIIFL